MINKKSILMSILLTVFLLGATSCDDNFIYEKEGDCTPKIQFIFKKHRQSLHALPGKEADVFYSTVESVHLFIYDAETGDLVYEKTTNTDNLQSASDLKLGTGTDRCYLPVDLSSGTYRIVAWCGLDENDSNNAFSLTEGNGRAQYTVCDVKRSGSTGRPVNDEKYQSLYHGYVQNVEVKLDGSNPQIIPVELTKDNNDIAVWVQHTTKTFQDGDYEVVYTDANGTMKFEDNTMAREEKLEYHPHTTTLLASDTEYNGELVETGALVAHISTSRLMAAHRNDARIEVRTREGKVVFSIPFIKYILQMQTLTSDDQHYLDCEDTYNCSFYLSGEDGTWTPARIIINNWVVVPGQGGIL